MIMESSSFWLPLTVSLLVIAVIHWIYRWRKPKCNGTLPPGSMGFPLVGETIQYLTTSESLDIHHFIKKRMKRYGPLFKTSLLMKPVVVSCDPDFNYYLLQQEGKLVERWYDFGKIFHKEVNSIAVDAGSIHKYVRHTVLDYFGPEPLKSKLLPVIESVTIQALHEWSKRPSIEVKHACAAMVCNFTGKLLLSYESENFGEEMAACFGNIFQGAHLIPLNIPGTAFNKKMKAKKKVIKLMRDLLEERRSHPEKRKGDFLDQIIEDMPNKDFLSHTFVVYFMFVLLIASFETVSSAAACAIHFLTDHPSVLQKLTEEHEEILKKKESANSGLSFKDYKSMTYTRYVINETLRFESSAPGLLRKAIDDIQVDGYTIPKGWTILVDTTTIHMNPNKFKDPLAFDPSRWEDFGALETAKNLIAFGGGANSCAGSEFARVVMSVFLHIFVTKYRWTRIKGGKVVRNPFLLFVDGFQIQVTEKQG